MRERDTYDRIIRRSIVVVVPLSIAAAAAGSFALARNRVGVVGALFAGLLAGAAIGWMLAVVVGFILAATYLLLWDIPRELFHRWFRRRVERVLWEIDQGLPPGAALSLWKPSKSPQDGADPPTPRSPE